MSMAIRYRFPPRPCRRDNFTLNRCLHPLIAVFAVALGARVTPAMAQTTQPEPRQSQIDEWFFSKDDGAFDISGFLATRQGFLPIVTPITEPAVGYGLSAGLTFFHEPIRVVTGSDGKPRALMPNTTVAAIGATLNGTWFTGLAHMHHFADGRIHYTGAAAYASAHLDWYGQGNAFEGESVSYTNNVFLIYQQLTFDLGESGFYAGPLYRFMATDATFGSRESDSQIPGAELQSQTSGLGMILGFDNRDHPFSPRRGIKAELSYAQQATWLGGDFDYGQLHGYVIGYVPINSVLTLGLRLDAVSVNGDVPFYDFASISLRGIPAGRYVDNDVAVLEAELRWDVSRRWSLVGFGGVGRIGDSFGDLLDADNELAGGVGVRYLISEKFGLRMGVDVAYGDDAASIYVTVGTGWIRP